MARRNIDRGDLVLRPQRDSHLFALINERRPASGFNSEFAVSAHQNALGAADGGPIEHYADVACDAEASRVSYSLPVEHQNVRLRFEFLPGFEQRRRLAEAQQSRDVRESRHAANAGGFDDPQIRESQNDYPGVDRLGVFIERDVRAGDRARGPREWLQTNHIAQPLLNLDRLAGSYVPTVQWIRRHL